MLDHLRVVNLGVLENAEIAPSPGFTVITGETGAGKTLLLGGLRLLLGGKPDSGAVGPYGEETQVEGLFSTGQQESGATRIVPRRGRSRSRLDGALVSTDTLESSLGSVVEIVGQHDQLGVTRSQVLIDLLDGLIAEQGAGERAAYAAAWSTYQDALQKQEKLGGNSMQLTRELDLLRYQATEIQAAGLEPDLDAGIESRVARLRNVGEIREHLAASSQLIEEATDLAGEAVSRLRKVAGLDPENGELSSQAEGSMAGLSELGHDVRRAAESLNDDPEALIALEETLTAIGDLKRKYGRTLEEVIAFGEGAAKRADEIQDLLAEAGNLEALLEETRDRVLERARALTDARVRTARAVEAEALRHLADLGLASARLAFRVSPVDPGSRGADRVDLLFSSDERMKPGSVGEVASGGELSRLILALRLATRAADTTTLVFDEVDSGIGGTTALEMGKKLGDLAASTQVLCVTHLAQIAAQADTHYVVERESGPATVRLVEGAERINEITRMLAGMPDSEAGRSTAEELLAAVGK